MTKNKIRLSIFRRRVKGFVSDRILPCIVRYCGVHESQVAILIELSNLDGDTYENAHKLIDMVWCEPEDEYMDWAESKID